LITFSIGSRRCTGSICYSFGAARHWYWWHHGKWRFVALSPRL